MTPDREVPIGALLARGIQQQEANRITGNKPAVLWHELARQDGGLALAVLTEAEFHLIVAELRRAGLPEVEPTQQEVLNLIWTIAASECPAFGTPWYSHELHSSVACAQLLTLVQQAWSFDAEQAKQRQLDLFAAKLGVPGSVEQL
jgi:hypothetical protein